MDVCSLEDDGDNDIFITQQFRSSNSDQNYGVLGDPHDFTSPCASLLSCRQSQYSDVSDDDFCDIPCSQISPTTSGGSTRYVVMFSIISLQKLNL